MATDAGPVSMVKACVCSCVCVQMDYSSNRPHTIIQFNTHVCVCEVKQHPACLWTQDQRELAAA